MPTFRRPVPASRSALAPLLAAAALLLACAAPPAAAQTGILPDNDLPARTGDFPGQGDSQGAAPKTESSSGPMELHSPAASDVQRATPGNGGAIPEGAAIARVRPASYRPSEFERYVNAAVRGESTPPPASDAASPPLPIRRFGASLLTDIGSASANFDPLPIVPDDYVIKPGDEIALTIWGSVDASLRATVDRAGRIAVPRIGAVEVAGLRYADLGPALDRRVRQTFKGFELTATMGRLRAVRVFVTGYAQTPGGITVSGLSSVLQAVMRAGGPSAAGSFRDIRLTRRGKQVAAYDLYDMLLRGDRRADDLVQPDDIIFVGPAGTEVAVVGSVNQPAIFELKPGETLSDALRMAGGFTPVADGGRVALERLADRRTGHVAELALPQHERDALRSGDIVSVYSIVAAALPMGHQNERVHVDGEVAAPGDYLLPPGSTVADALRAAGGMTSAAYPYGTEFTRRAVRISQQANYERALRELETNMAKNDATQRIATQDESTARAASVASNARLLERLRALTPSGRIVLEVNPDDVRLPDIALEDGDSLHIPARDTSVGVFGSVFNTGSFLFRPGRTTEQYLRLAGGPTVGADKRSMFVIHANGSVVSAQQGASFWHSGNDFRAAEVLPGDTIFVPEELNKSTFVQDAKDWTQILYQFGLGLAGIKALGL
jgi:protein involved in polysaccharide export with SLBB domain